MDIGERIKRRREELGLSVIEVARLLNKNRATVYRYEDNSIKDMPLTVLEPLAKVLKTTPAYLIGWNDDSSEDSEDNTEIIPVSQRKIRLLNGAIMDNVELSDENISFCEALNRPIYADFAFCASDDSMNGANILAGNIVLFTQNEEIKTGDIVLLSINDQLILRRITFCDDHTELWPENSTYQAIIIPRKNKNTFRVLGKAVAYYNTLF